MNTKKRFTIFLTLVALVFVLTACGTSKYVGEWQIAGINNNGKEIDLEASKSLSQATSLVTLIIEKGGTAKMQSGDETSELQWEATDDGIILFEEGDRDHSVPYTYKDGQLICTYGNVETRMEKK